MSLEYLAAAIHPQLHPPVLFACGLIASLLVCTLSLLIDSNLRTQRLMNIEANQADGYSRFRDELTHSARHVDFADNDIIELRDDDFQST